MRLKYGKICFRPTDVRLRCGPHVFFSIIVRLCTINIFYTELPLRKIVTFSLRIRLGKKACKPIEYNKKSNLHIRYFINLTSNVESLPCKIVMFSPRIKLGLLSCYVINTVYSFTISSTVKYSAL